MINRKLNIFPQLEDFCFKLFTDFTWDLGVHGTVTSSGIRFNLSVLNCSTPMAATANFKVSQIGPIAPLQLSVDHFEPIHDTIIDRSGRRDKKKI